MSKSIENYLKTMRAFWQKEPDTAKALAPFWLTPEERYTLLKELMQPISHDRQSGR